MNVALDYQPNCVVALDIDLPADQVGKAWDSVSKEFQTKARIAGFRPGKAPAALVASRYANEIKEEVIGNIVRK
ncbi:MAG: trigger factor, partial [Terrimicrobiaceae bacterium]